MESNEQKMREALEAVVKVGYPHNFQREAPHIREYCVDITRAIKKCFAALSAPPRNCDAGTADEQSVRCLATMRHWRKAYQGDALITAIMEWAQTPYEEGGAK